MNRKGFLTMRLCIVGLLLVHLCMIASCKKDPVLPPPLPDFTHISKNALVINEGNYMWGNASLTHINLETNEITDDVFSRANSRPLGDVAQSMIRVGQELWIIVNNSQKIERLNARTFKSIGTISPFHSPRYACLIDMNKMFITDLYVCNVKKNKLMVLNPATNQIIDSVSVGDAPRYIQKDNEGRIWVLCEGNLPPHETKGSLYCIDPMNHFQILKRIEFPESSIHPSQLKISASGDKLYFLYNGVWSLDVESAALPQSPLIVQGERLFYGLEIQTETGDIWVTDAGDYVQRGKIYRYSADSKELLKTYQAGIIPGNMYFY
jgi:YVTN family beta-propeller protein